MVWARKHDGHTLSTNATTTGLCKATEGGKEVKVGQVYVWYLDIR